MEVPGTGHPDGEARGMPHGESLVYETGQTATVAGLVRDNAGDGWHVAGYRSIVVVVQNNGANDIVVTPRWSFWIASSSFRTTDAQTVPAGTTKRLIFQNQADFLQRVTFSVAAGTSGFSWYLTGSNLDPFSAGAREMLMMIQRTPAQSIPNNAGTLIEFGPTVGTRFYTNAAQDWTFDVTGAGDYNGVHIIVPGLYLLIAHLTFAAPGNYNKQMQLNANSAEINPIGNATELDRSFDTFADTLRAETLFVLSGSSATAAGNTVTVSGLQVSGAPVTVDSAALYICRLGSVFP